MLFLAFDECYDDIHATVVVLLGEDAASPGIGRIADIAHNLPAEEERQVVHGGIEQFMAFFVIEVHAWVCRP